MINMTETSGEEAPFLTELNTWGLPAVIFPPWPIPLLGLNKNVLILLRQQPKQLREKVWVTTG